MSKKKSFSGSTMTLKDFHGGSIPSDLPLPSAPGASMRPPDRWGPQAIGARPDSINRQQRPGSAGSAGPGGARLGSGGVADERGPPFLSTPANIGRHFDEDERKPFDASTAFPRRQAPPTMQPDPVARPAPFAAAARSDPKPQAQPQPPLRSSAGAAPNAWGLRKEEVKPAVDPVPPPVQAISAVSLTSRFAQASAIEKISSGRWQTKPVTPPSPEVDVSRFQDSVSVVEEARVSLPLQQESVKETVWYNERASHLVPNEARVIGGQYLQQHQPQQQKGAGMDVGDRPKLKLPPRTRAGEVSEPRAYDDKQGQPPVRIENPHKLQENPTISRPASAGEDVGSRVSERPRLNLKPRSLPVDQLDEITERERKSVFGGARPRELVLKERGVDDIVAISVEVTSPVNRFKTDTPKADIKPKQEASTLTLRRSERPQSFPVEQRNGKDFDKNTSRPDNDKADSQRASWRNDNWKNNNREVEKQVVERRPEPETWRKPIEQPKPEVPGPVSRPGKAASALELAQAFSRSVSDGRANDSLPGQSGLPGRAPVVPFSRLTDNRDLYPSTNSRQINGY